MRVNLNKLDQKILKDIKLKPRLTKITTVHYEMPDEKPLTVESRIQRESDSEDQPSTRHMNLTDKWEPIDSGWISNPSSIIIQGRKPQHSIVPPREVREAEADTMVELAYVMPSDKSFIIPLFEIPVGEAFDFYPKNHKILAIRVSRGTLKCVVICLP